MSRTQRFNVGDVVRVGYPGCMPSILGVDFKVVQVFIDPPAQYTGASNLSARYTLTDTRDRLSNITAWDWMLSNAAKK